MDGHMFIFVDEAVAGVMGGTDVDESEEGQEGRGGEGDDRGRVEVKEGTDGEDSGRAEDNWEMGEEDVMYVRYLADTGRLCRSFSLAFRLFVCTSDMDM